MTISTITARAEFTNALIAVYKERVVPMSFLRSFFKPVEKSTFSVSVAIQRGTEKIAVDVERGTNGNRNTFAKSTEKDTIPPYYYEWFNINELDIYRTLFTSTDISVSVFTEFLQDVVDRMKLLQDTIERAYEKQCADVLMTGIVLTKDVNIDFKRKAGSLVDLGAGNYWTTTTVDPMVALENGGKFVREIGKAQGGVYNVVAGSLALNAFMNNPIFQAKMNLRHVTFGEIMEPQRNALGASLHGRVSAGAYTFNLWSYPEGFEDASGVFQYYIDPKKVVIIPETPNFVLAYAAVPQLPSLSGGVIKKGAYIFTDGIDANGKNHKMEVESTGIAMPIAVDQIYTVKVVA